MITPSRALKFCAFVGLVLGGLLWFLLNTAPAQFRRPMPFRPPQPAPLPKFAGGPGPMIGIGGGGGAGGGGGGGNFGGGGGNFGGGGGNFGGGGGNFGGGGFGGGGFGGGGGGMMGMGGGMGGMMGMMGGGMMGMGGGGMMGMGGGMMGMGGGMMGMGGGMGGMMGMMGCHPGCFPAGTPVATPSGPRAIETIKAGALVLGVDKNGKVLPATVHSAFDTKNYLWEVETESGLLITTGKQPLCLSCGCVKIAPDLEAGDELIRWEDGKSRPTKVRSARNTERLVAVFNLVLKDQDYYIVDGFQVRSKPPLTAKATIAGEKPVVVAVPEESDRKSR